MADLVERVARLLHRNHGFYPWDDLTTAHQNLWRDTAREVIDMIAATPLSASAEDRAATDGAGQLPPQGQGPHDAIGDPCGGSAEGTLPAPKDDTIDDGFGNAWVRCGSDCDMHVVRPGKAQCNAGGVNCPTKEARP